MTAPRLARPFALLAFAVAAASFVSPRAEARPILSGILPEHAIFPGSPGSYTFFSGGDGPLTDAQRLRLKGPVTSVKISVVINAQDGPGEPNWISQGAPAYLFLNENRDLKEVSVGKSEYSPAVKMVGEHDYTGEGAARRRSEARIKVIVAGEEREFSTQKFTYDDKGRLIKVDSITPQQPEAHETFEYSAAGGIATYNRMDPGQSSSISKFNDDGRMIEQTWIDAATGQPVDNSKRVASWKGDTALVSDGTDQPCESCGEFTFDDKGSLLKWHLGRSQTIYALRNALEYDAKGNWISMTTSLLDNPVDDSTAKPILRYTRDITYDGDPLPVVPAEPKEEAPAPAPATEPAPAAEPAKAPDAAPPAKKD